MNMVQTLIIIVFSGVSGMLGATYTLNNHESQKVVILDIKEWSQSVLDEAKLNKLSKQDIEVEKRILAKEVNKRLDEMNKKGVLVLDARAVLTAPSDSFLERGQ